MKPWIYLILFLLILGLPFLLRGAMTSAPAQHAQLRLVVVTPNNQDIRREFGYAFSDWHQKKYGEAVEMDYRTPGGTNDIKRLLENTYAPYRDAQGKISGDVPADIDVVWGGGDYFFYSELKKLGSPPMNVLQPIRLDPKILAEAFPADRLAGVRLYDSVKDANGNQLPPTWVGVALSSFGIVYNPDVYATLNARPANRKNPIPEPRTWHDLTRPELAGLVALADPAHSGSAGVAFLMVIQRRMADAEEALLKARPELAAMPHEQVVKQADYQEAIAKGWKAGMSDLFLIAANARYFSDSAFLVPMDVANGEAAAGMAIDFYGRVYQEAVGPSRCRFLSPVAATAITPDPVGILHGVKGRQYELALHFVEFLLSPQGQRLWIVKPGLPDGPRFRALRRPPIRRDVYADRTGWSDEVNYFEEAGGFNQRGEWMSTFTDTRMIWAAAWVDARDAMQKAYRRILNIKNNHQRDTLLAELADLPITLAEVQEMPTRMEREAGGNVDEWRARVRLEWANRFRKHYKQIEEKVDERAQVHKDGKKKVK
jgi:ABC-type Fe3+ transport system substrate-binding protein